MALVAPLVFGLRFTARRRPLLALLEVLAVAAAVVAYFAAHHDGMVHRPLAIGDWAWSRGIDPAVVFLLLGGLAAALLAALLVSEERGRRLPLHFGALVLVALALLLIIRVGGLPKPQPAGDLGLTGDPETAQEGEGEEGEGGGQGGEPDDQLEDLEFQDEYSSAGGQAPVAVVLLHDDYSPPSGVYYFRQSAFSQYNGRRLVQATRGDADRDVLRRFPTRLLEVPDAPPLSRGRQELATSMGLLVDHVRPFALDSPAAIRPVRNANPLRFQRLLEVESRVQTLPYPEMIGRLPGDEDWSGPLWEHYVEAPRDPRYADTANELMSWLRDEYRSDPLAQALAIKTFSRRERHLQPAQRSRRRRLSGSLLPVRRPYRLLRPLTGYCVHFAHAATYLFRSRGIPARVAAGYAVAESSRGGGSTIMIRSGDAHAWPEIYLEDIGWVVVDLSPQQTLDEPNSAADPDLQRMLGEMMRQEMSEQEDFQQQVEPPWSLADLARYLAAILLALLVVAYAVKLYRAQAPRFVRPGQLYRVGYRAPPSTASPTSAPGGTSARAASASPTACNGSPPPSPPSPRSTCGAPSAPAVWGTPTACAGYPPRSSSSCASASPPGAGCWERPTRSAG